MREEGKRGEVPVERERKRVQSFRYEMRQRREWEKKCKTVNQEVQGEIAEVEGGKLIMWVANIKKKNYV